MNTAFPPTAFQPTAYRLPIILGIVLLFCFVNVNAQRLEVHAIKDLSPNEIANKAWGVGAAVDLDQWVKKTIFRVHFDWAMHRKTDDIANHHYQRMSGGISALYSLKIIDKLTFRCGVEVNYSYIRHSYIYEIVNQKANTWLQNAHFIGIGPHVALNYELGRRFNVVFNFVPVYLITVSTKSNLPGLESEYNKGLWLFPLQLGLSYKIFNPN